MPQGQVSWGKSSRGQMYSKAQGLWCEVAVWLNQWWLQGLEFYPYSLAVWPQESLYCSSLSLWGTVKLRGHTTLWMPLPSQHSPPNLRHVIKEIQPQLAAVGLIALAIAIDSGEEPRIKEKNSL